VFTQSCEGGKGFSSRSVIPAKAGIQRLNEQRELDSRLRGNDGNGFPPSRLRVKLSGVSA
jgi:hypothetical protein